MSFLGTERKAKIIWNDEYDSSVSFSSSYKENGYVHFPNFIDRPLVDKILSIVESIDFKDQQVKGIVSEIGHPDIIRSVFDLHNLNVQLAQLLRSQRISELARGILGSDYNIHQCHINYKRNGLGGGFGWHSDYTYWHYEDGMSEPRALSLFFVLDEVTEASGPLRVIPGSHTRWFKRNWQHKKKNHNQFVAHSSDGSDDDPGIFNRREVDSLSNYLSPPVSILARAGDLILMDANLIHSSEANRSLSDRRMLIAVLNSVENKLNWVEPERRRPNFITDRTNQELN